MATMPMGMVTMPIGRLRSIPGSIAAMAIAAMAIAAMANATTDIEGTTTATTGVVTDRHQARPDAAARGVGYGPRPR